MIQPARTIASAGVLFATFAVAIVAAQPADKKPAAATPPAMTEEMQAMMAACEAAAKPGVQHAILNELVGSWDASIKMWMPGVEEPSVSAGVMVNTMIHDGRFLHHEFRGEFEGKPFTGSGQFAYNNTGKRWEGTWQDSMSTMIQFSTGAFDGQRGEWTMSTEFDHPLGYRCKKREVITLRGKNAHAMVMFCTDKDGKEQRIMEISYTRKPAPDASK